VSDDEASVVAAGVPVLPDLVRAGLKVIFCGTAAGRQSAEKRQYFAGRGNRFWRILHATGLTPGPLPLRPDQWAMLDRFDIGATDLAKLHFGADSSLPMHGFDRDAVRAIVDQFAPRALAFNGKKAAEVFLGRRVEYGCGETIWDTAVWVLPSTSGLAIRYWDEKPWRDLAKSLD
jgi:TDG/mug DNA glycosylase family protein